MSILLCTQCGEEYQSDDTFCVSCGANLKIQNVAGLKEFKKVLSSRLNTDKIEYFQSLVAKLKELEGIPEQVQQQNNRGKKLEREIKSAIDRRETLRAYESHSKKKYDKLKNFSFTKIIAKIRGNYDEQLKRAQSDYMDKVALTNENLFALEALQKERDQVIADLDRLIAMEEDYKKMKIEHDNFINNIMEGVSHPEEDKLESVVEAIKNQGNPMRQQAMQLGDALNHLNRASRYYHQAEQKMRSAKNYADWDTFAGGGFFIDAAKNSNQSEARRLVNQGNRELQHAQSILPQMGGMRGAFVEAAQAWDMFFDNIFTDLHSRSRIERGLQNVRNAISNVNELISKVRSEKQRVESQLNVLYETYTQKQSELMQMRIKLIEDYIGGQKKSK